MAKDKKNKGEKETGRNNAPKPIPAGNKCKICGKDSGKYPLCKKCYAEQRAKERAATVSKKEPERNNAPKPIYGNSPKLGTAVRSRDEYFLDGVPKPDKENVPREYYRVGYEVYVNDKGEVGLVKSTTASGRRNLPSGKGKFSDVLYIQDDKGNFIKIDGSNPKFVLSPQDNISAEDVAYIRKRLKYLPDTDEKVKKLKDRDKK